MRCRLLLIILAAAACLAQTAQRPGMSYAVENPPNPQLAVRQIRGEAVDPIHMGIPLVELGLYTGAAPHKLLAVGSTDENGKFDFGKKVAPGKYHLIALYPGLCTANIPLLVNRHGSGKKIILHMTYPGLGACSYASLK
ncbi:MAG: hypothetical protein EPN33_05495 [Acidobacteria bacterium]|nr:MAG: hypothetical protein EPN33_05495 [Acidobacteriota bacterium]